MSSPHDTLRIAHSARCKLQMAANRPDRNFRFILGHALTLDKLMLRVAEIEIDNPAGDEEGVADEEPHGTQLGTHGTGAGAKGRRVSFSAGSSTRPVISRPGNGSQRRSPPPEDVPYRGADDDDEDDGAMEDDEDEDGLGLQRFPSASAQPSRMTGDEDEGIGDMQEQAGGSERLMPSEDELRQICGEDGDETMAKMYNGMVRCPCNEDHAVAPRVTKFWEVPGRGPQKGRFGVVQVEA